MFVRLRFLVNVFFREIDDVVVCVGTSTRQVQLKWRLSLRSSDVVILPASLILAGQS